MLQRDLKTVVNESLFNPNKPTVTEKVLLEVGNPKYWQTKAVELIRSAESLTQGSTAYHDTLREAIKLLILARAKCNDEKNKKRTKTRNNPTGKHSKISKTT